ncbi:uncharacterized protein LOC100679446 [Nasonia vitripennis]|uniref:Uncharacterized protein n=1 Tax=Nasonia vitripennis TaxID=7425 RepID=A0A7M7H2G0_NASVI|nr:uncharacterized protein LOC100679446 [Nasonia vitripennis]
MNYIKITDHDKLAAAAESSGKVLVKRITQSWQEDLWLRKKWNFTEDSKELYMKEICFMIGDDQIELLHPVMEEEPKCKVTFGQGNLQTLSLVLKFKLNNMKVTGTMRSYSSSKPCKSFPYELFLKDVEFEIVAGLIIRGDSFCIENYSNNYLNFNLSLSYKTKDESKEIFPLDKIQDSDLRKSIEIYILDKLTKDIVLAVEDRVGEECVDTSVSSMLDNEYSYRNKLRLHKKKMTSAFQKLVVEIVGMLNHQLEDKKLNEISLPNLYGKLLEKDNQRGTFTASQGYLKNLASLQQLGDITVHQDGEDIIIFVFLYFSYLDIVYKNLSINRKDLENTKSFETPENSNSSYMKIKIRKVNDERINLTLLDYKVDDLGYIEVIWDAPENDTFKKYIEPELAMWLNYALEYQVTPIIEERIKNCLAEVLKNEKLSQLVLHPQDTDDGNDSDPLNEVDEEDEEEIDDGQEVQSKEEKDDDEI